MDIYAHTSSAGGVIIRDAQVLVITSARRRSVDLPKGTVELEESLQATATREVKEETGYDVFIQSDLGSITYDFDSNIGKRYRKTVSYFLMQLSNDNQPEKDLQHGEDFENEWLTYDEAMRRLTYADARDIVIKAFATIQGDK